MPIGRLMSAMASFVVVFVVLLATALAAILNICPSLFIVLMAMGVLWGLTATDPLIGSLEAIGAMGGAMLIMIGVAMIVAFRVTCRNG